jgi:hypothetical protein
MSKKLKAERRTMETRIYPTRDLDVQKIAQALVSEYQGKGFEAQQFGDSNQASVQLRKTLYVKSQKREREKQDERG